MAVTPEQRERLRPALARLLDETDEDTTNLLARAYAELAVLLTGLRDLTEPPAG